MKNISLNTTVSDDEGEEEIDYDEADKIEHIDTVLYNVVVGMNDTTLHNVENYLDNNGSIYR